MELDIYIVSYGIMIIPSFAEIGKCLEVERGQT
jgi:hypothetical protein